MQKNTDTLANLIDTITEMKDSERKAARIRKIVPIEEWINDTYYVGPDALSIYPYWKRHIINIFNSPIRINEVILTGCFIGSTKISLLDGRDLTMKELTEEFGMNKEFWVYSVDTTTGKIVPGKAKHARKTGVNRPVYCLELDNGEKFYCTDNHKFLKRDLTYCELKDLKVGDSLYPFITHNRYSNKYETIYDAHYHKDIPTHRMVYGNVDEKNKNKVVHHINHDKHNNVPDNLVEMTRSDYNKHHTSNLTNGYKNHRVVSITFSHYEDVYDFEVEKYHNFALTNGVFVHNSLGTGKTTIANIIMLRKIYELSCYNNIPALFNLMASSKVLFAYFNLNMAQAELTGFGQLKEMIDNCPYFQENFQRDLKNNSMIKFTQANMSVRFASDNSHIIGSNLVAGLLDEANFYKGSDLTAESVIAQNKAARLYSDIRNRR